MELLILFDIDGTLINTGGAGLRSIARVLKESFGIENSLKNFPLAGRTDFYIIKSLMEHFNLGKKKYKQIKSRYLNLLKEEIEKESQNKRIMPGIKEILKYIKNDPAIYSGLLTGNFKRGARIKLGHFNLNHYFLIGAYGDKVQDRKELLPLALKELKNQLGWIPDLNKVFIIGDTPLDIDCARANNVKAIAVATGPYTYEDLKTYKPDFIFYDFSEYDKLIKILKEAS